MVVRNFMSRGFLFLVKFNIDAKVFSKKTTWEIYALISVGT